MGAAMALTIVVLAAETEPRPSITFDSPRVVIGRGDGADVRLPDPSVSHRHATLRQRGSDYLIVDEGSTNGTFVGRERGMVRLAPQSPRVVKSGDRVRVGRIELELRIEHGVPVTESPLATRELALELVSAALAAQGEHLAVRVSATQPGGASAELVLAELGREYVVGRGNGCDLRLDDADCSRRHVGITRRGSGLIVRDLGSKNGCKLGDERIEKSKEAPWTAGVPLQLGDTVLGYEDPTVGALEELESAADEPVEGEATNARAEPSAGKGEESAARADTGRAPVNEATRAKASSERATPATKTRRPLDPRLGDLLVGLLALVVLGLSLLGLHWLFTSQ
jgi:pSer/pThr/pTyr-binding forkhead associated (FHA) protein